MRNRRLLWQLYPTYLLVTLLSLVAAGVYAWKELDRFYREETTDDLEARAHLLEEDIRAKLVGREYDEIQSMCEDLGRRSATRITVILPDGIVVGDSHENPVAMDNHAERPEIRTALGGRIGSSSRYSTTLRENRMYVAIPVRQGAEIIGVVRTSIPTTAIEGVMAALQGKFVLAGLVVALIAAGLTLVISRRISRPLEEIQQGAERFAQGDLGHKLPIPNSREAAALAETMNKMAAQLDDRMRAVLKARNEREAVLSSMVEGVLAVDSDERVISMNRAAAALLGVDPPWAEGRSLQEAVRNLQLQQLVARVLSNGQSSASELEIFLRDGESRALHAQGTILRDDREKPIGAVVVLHDVTRLRRLENVRRDFVANVSHELRTPITSIKGFVETLIDGAMDDPRDAERFLHIILVQADRLNAIIEDLLALSRIEQGEEKAEIVLEEGVIRQVLLAAMGDCQLKASERQIQLELSCPEDLSARINADLLEQAVVNLIDNAVKYSSEGETVRVVAERSEGEIVIRVQDRGCGIAREHLPRIFERFYRVDRARSRQLGGTGLGLAIVKHIAQSHGGRATVHSKVGEGSEFSIHLPSAG
jgi:two-component system phosphate regulon sensor histidine kinase PhoR